MYNLFHISLTPFLFETRVLKEVRTASRTTLFNSIYVLALHREGLKKIERIGEHGILIRIKPILKSNALFKYLVPLTYFELFIRILWFIPRKRKNILTIHVISLLPLAYLIKILRGCKIIYDAHELETHTTNKKLEILLYQLTEFIFVRFVDVIVVVNESIRSIYADRFPKKVVYSIYNAPHFKKYKKSDLLRQELLIPDNKIIFLYQGGLVEGRGIRLILEAFKLLCFSEYVVVFMGYGELSSLIKKYADSNKNIYHLSAVRPEKLLDYTISCDYGLSLIENSCLSYYYCLPNKVLEYLICGKPVLVSNLIEQKRLIGNNQLGIVIDEFTIESIIKGIREIVELDVNLIQENIKLNIYTYTWEAQEKKLIKIYKDILKPNEKKFNG